MSEPFENKYRQIRTALTGMKVRYNELEIRYKAANAMYKELYHQLKLANSALIKAGYRRLDDMTWTNEPFDDQA